MYRHKWIASAMTVAAVLCLGLANPAGAAVLVSDNFDSYTPGTIVGQGTVADGWTGAYSGLACTKGTSTALRDVTSGVMPGIGQSLALGFAVVQPTGAPANNNIVQREFEPQNGTPVYIGFSLRTLGFDLGGSGVTAGDMVQLFVNNAVNTSATYRGDSDALSCGVDFSPPPDGDNGAYFVRKGGDQTASSLIHTDGAVHRLVMKVSQSFPGSLYDEVSLFVDQGTEGTPDAIRGSFESTNPSFSTLSVFHMRIWGMELEDRVYVDNLTVATTYAEALPPEAQWLPGDTDGNGIVNDVDAANVAASWLQSVMPGDRQRGDFNTDGVVDDRDAAILAAHWVRGSEGASVPEPSTIALLLAGAAAMLPRRRARS